MQNQEQANLKLQKIISNAIVDKENEIEKLREENEELKDKLIDLTFELNYNKETELIEFLREIYSSVKEELNLKTKSKLTKTEVLYSLKKYIEEFAKDNKIML